MGAQRESELLEKAKNDEHFDCQTIEVGVQDLLEILQENARLRARETELLVNNSALVIENRGYKEAFKSFPDTIFFDRSLKFGFSSVLRSQVRAFMYAFDQPVRETPCEPAGKLVRLRAELILEEAFEFAGSVLSSFQDAHTPSLLDLREQAIKIIRDSRSTFVDICLVDAADALADLAYVTEGAWLTFGIDPQPVLDAVHEANMKKIGGPIDPQSGKRLKPPGWTPPDIASVLRAQGWKP